MERGEGGGGAAAFHNHVHNGFPIERKRGEGGRDKAEGRGSNKYQDKEWEPHTKLELPYRNS